MRAQSTLAAVLLTGCLCGACADQSRDARPTTLAANETDAVPRIHCGTLARTACGWRFDRATADGGSIDCNIGDQLEQARIFEGKRCRVVGVIEPVPDHPGGGSPRMILRATYIQPHDLERYQ